MSSYERRSKFYRKLLNSCLELFALAAISEKDIMSGYELIGYCHKRFDVLLSPAYIYPLLNKMKKENLIAPRDISSGGNPIRLLRKVGEN